MPSHVVSAPIARSRSSGGPTPSRSRSSGGRSRSAVAHDTFKFSPVPTLSPCTQQRHTGASFSTPGTSRANRPTRSSLRRRSEARRHRSRVLNIKGCTNRSKERCWKQPSMVCENKAVSVRQRRARVWIRMIQLPCHAIFRALYRRHYSTSGASLSRERFPRLASPAPRLRTLSTVDALTIMFNLAVG